MVAIEKRAVLYRVTSVHPSRQLHLSASALQVLEALEYVHSHGIAYRNLTPEHIMWFANEFTWKLVDLVYASSEGEPTIRHPIGIYESPESIEAEKHGKEWSLLHPAADMWSFGVIAFEVLTSAVRMPSGSCVCVCPCSIVRCRFRRHPGGRRQRTAGLLCRRR